MKKENDVPQQNRRQFLGKISKATAATIAVATAKTTDVVEMAAMIASQLRKATTTASRLTTITRQRTRPT